jgi:uncharacterized protein YhdP
MKYLLSSLSRLLIVFLASSIVFFALVVLIGRILTPYLNKQAQTIEHIAGNVLHKPVQINQFSVVWQGLTPIFRGSHVIIWDDTRTYPLLDIKQLNMGIDIFNSLLTGGLKLGKINVSGVALIAHQTKDNQFIFTGISTIFNQSGAANLNGSNELMGWLLAEPQLSLENISLKFYPKSGLEWPLMQINLVLKNSGARHRLSGTLRLLDEKYSELIFKTDLSGSLSASLKGRIYLQGRDILLDRWLHQWQQTISTQNAKTTFSVWADWQQDHFTHIQGLFSNRQVFSLKIGKQPLVTFSPFSAHLLWQAVTNNNWTIDANVQNFGSLPWQKIPGINGLDAYLHVTDSSGSLIAHSNDLDLDFKGLFKAPLHLNSLSSEVNWQKKGDEYSIQVAKFEANNQDASVNAQAGVLIPHDRINSQISLLASVKTLHPESIGYYLPQTLLGPDLIHWLSHSIIQGSGTGSLVLQGPINQFPFDKNNGTFLIDTQIKNATLNYQPGWPSAQQIDGELIFSGRQMQILVDTAQVFATTLKGIKVSIPAIKKQLQAVLHIATSTIDTRLETGRAFLMATPLAKGVLSQLSSLILTGPLQLSFQLSIPLESGKERLKLLGEASIEHAKVSIPAHNIQLDDLKGPFSFTQDGILAQKLTAVLWGNPIELAIRSTPSIQLTIRYNGLQTDLQPEKNAWLFSINNKNVKGTVLIPNDNRRALQANFDTIYLDSSIASHNMNTWNLKQIPKIELNAREVRYQTINFGAVHLRLSPLLGGVLVRELQAGNANYHLMASGAWHTQDTQSTELMGQLDSPNLSDFLRSLGLPASLIAEQTHIRFNLNWPSAPYNISLAKLRGNFSFSATKGQIVDIGSSAEAKLNFGRLLTFLSVQSLTRRLQLDFSDLQAKGFDFTSLEGNFSLRNGNAITRDTNIEGAVAAIAITGRIGIVNKDYDLLIKVVPHFTSSLPVIVGLAGGPVAGIVAWAANAILGSTVQKIAETSYHITGAWSKPEVVKTSA